LRCKLFSTGESFGLRVNIDSISPNDVFLHDVGEIFLGDMDFDTRTPLGYEEEGSRRRRLDHLISITNENSRLAFNLSGYSVHAAIKNSVMCELLLPDDELPALGIVVEPQSTKELLFRMIVDADFEGYVGR
jgi:hypothetical protein